MSKLSEHLKGKVKVTTSAGRKEPLWKGPEVSGITFSLLSRFLVCRERFRLKVVEGWAPAPCFSHRLEFGQMWHTCEEALAAGVVPGNREDQWAPLQRYVMELAQRYPMDRPQIEHWAQVCKATFPIYVAHWRKHPDVKDRTPLLQEREFSVAYKLPSGRLVRLRGKFDAVDLIGKPGAKGTGIYLQENKTKGDINPIDLRNQLTYDLQTMIYLTALQEARATPDEESWIWDLKEKVGNAAILGVRYNVIRRPLSGGKYSIVQHKATKSNPLGEDKRAYYRRLAEAIEGDPEYFFMRWKVEVSAADVKKFRRECLDPILEQLCDWWDWVCGNPDPFAGAAGIHWRHPYGVYNVLNEGGHSDLDAFLDTGSTVGLAQVDRLFPELSADD